MLTAVHAHARAQLGLGRLGEVHVQLVVFEVGTSDTVPYISVHSISLYTFNETFDPPSRGGSRIVRTTRGDDIPGAYPHIKLRAAQASPLAF